MYCSNCGNKLDDNQKYCSECGAKINRKEANVDPLVLFVLVSLLDGSNKQLYFLNNIYYENKECTKIFPINLIANPFNHQVIDTNPFFLVIK